MVTVGAWLSDGETPRFLFGKSKNTYRSVDDLSCFFSRRMTREELAECCSLKDRFMLRDIDLFACCLSEKLSERPYGVFLANIVPEAMISDFLYRQQ